MPQIKMALSGHLYLAEVLGRYSKYTVVTWPKIQAAWIEAKASVREGEPTAPGWQAHALKRRFSSAVLAQLAADYEAGLGSSTLALKYKISENAVLAQLRWSGVKLRAPGKVTPEDVVEMARLRQEGWTYQAIGEKFGVTRVAVKRRLMPPADRKRPSPN